MELPVIECNQKTLVECHEKTVEMGIEIFRLSWKEEMNIQKEETVTFSWKVPYLDSAGIWHPRCGFNRSVGADWDGFLKSMTASSAPVFCIFSEEGENRFTLAVSETKEIVNIRAGVHEEDGTLLLQVQVPASYLAKAEQVLKVRLDTRKTPFYRAIQDVSLWWEKDCKILPIYAPEAAKDPVYSTWYSYHQKLKDTEIEEECRLAAELGFKTVIVDDGWQTDDENRGYAFCGDWEVSKNRFPDFAGHIQKIHDMGMKYMIWYSVPFLGSKSQKWEEFKGKLLSYNDDIHFKAGVLDPRYKEVRDYLGDTYIKAITEWKLDGLKLDFIDCILEREATQPYQPGAMDFESVQEALDCMMRTIYERMAHQKEDVMVEFRQSYIGPNMRRYGNMFRVTDCPNSGISNRVGIVDLRMLSGKTSVHSDPLMWHVQEKPELAAIQIISSIFATPQISVKMGELTDEMRSMLKFWMEFMQQNKNLLQEEPICALEPQNLYPVAWTQGQEKAIIAIYSEERIVKLPAGVTQCVILNGTKGKRITIETVQEASCEVKDCCGRIVKEKTLLNTAGLHIIQVPTAGLLTVYTKTQSFTAQIAKQTSLLGVSHF